MMLCAGDVVKRMVQVGLVSSWHFDFVENLEKQLHRHGLPLYCKRWLDMSFSLVSIQLVIINHFSSPARVVSLVCGQQLVIEQNGF